ncbi:MAG: hypothetical protein LUQ51_05965 [Methanothrix sp.]|nr:hypothetical protein [Methanothrix sp.]
MFDLRFNSLCLSLLALILIAGSSGAAETNSFPLDQSLEDQFLGGQPTEDQFAADQSAAIGDLPFSQSFVESLLGIGGTETDLSQSWFGPRFEDAGSAYSFFSQFYISTSAPVSGGFAPVKIDINKKLPAKLYFGSGKEIAYKEYQSAISPARGNELWIQKYMDWSQYAIVPQGAGMQFIAFTPTGGQADYYEIFETGVQKIDAKQVNFYAGYNALNFLADKVGRHILFFVLNNQPSNAIIVDVISQPPTAASASEMPPGSDMPPAYGQAGAVTAGYGQPTKTTPIPVTTTPSTAPGITTPFSTMPGQSQPTQFAVSGDTPVTIQSPTMRGYQVYLDGVLIGTEGTAGDAPDGKFSFRVVGDQEHNIRVYDGQFNYPRSIYFQRGVLKIINVAQGYAAYF